MAARADQRRGWRYRANVAARVLAATVGGYAVGSCLAMAIARLFGFARIEAAMAGTMCAYLAMPAVAIWAFLARGPVRAWAGVLAMLLLLGGGAWLIGPPVR